MAAPNLKNQNGMSLVTVLAGVAITSLMALAMASIAHNMSRVHETAKARENATATTFLVTSFLQDSGTCKQSLIGASVSGIPLSTVEGGKKVGSIMTVASKTIFKKGHDEVSNMVLEPIKGDAALGRVPMAHSRYLGQLRLEFDQKKSLLGGGVGARTIPILLTLNSSGRAIDCRAVAQGDDGTSDLVDEMEHLVASPHTDPTNCQGQYYPVGAGRNPASDTRGLEGLTPVDPQTRFQLLTQSPPPFVGSVELTRGDGNYSSYQRSIRYSKKPSIIGSRTSETTGEIKVINGVRYYVTPTLSNGWNEGFGGGVQCRTAYRCVAGTFETHSQVGESCGGGHRD